MNTESVAEIPESRFLKLLHEDAMCRGWILPGFNAHWPFFDVPLHEVVQSSLSPQGDVDLLALPIGRPHDATAIQFKRVKVTATTFRTGMPNKLHEISKPSRQANLLVGLGFHDVAATVLVLVDARESGSPDPWLSQTPTRVIQAVDQAFAEAGFRPEVRVEVVEVCQPFDVDFRLRGSTSRRQLQGGSRLTQSAELTAALEGLVRAVA